MIEGKKRISDRLHGSKPLEVACWMMMFFSNFKLKKTEKHEKEQRASGRDTKFFVEE